jgi:hypothetical protein
VRLAFRRFCRESRLATVNSIAVCFRSVFFFFIIAMLYARAQSQDKHLPRCHTTVMCLTLLAQRGDLPATGRAGQSPKAL